MSIFQTCDIIAKRIRTLQENLTRKEELLADYEKDLHKLHQLEELNKLQGQQVIDLTVRTVTLKPFLTTWRCGQICTVWALYVGDRELVHNFQTVVDLGREGGHSHAPGGWDEH